MSIFWFFVSICVDVDRSVDRTKQQQHKRKQKHARETKSEQGDPNERAWGVGGVGLAFARRNQEPSSLFSRISTTVFTSGYPETI
jgi:hypothetical protein